MEEKKQAEKAKSEENGKEGKELKELESLKAQLFKSEEIAKDYSDHLKRLQAEFENYIKRIEKEREEFRRFATERLILKLLVIIDDFRRAVQEFEGRNLPKELSDGIKMIFNNLHKILEEEGIKEIEVLNKKFDPYKHEVLLSESNKNIEDNLIVQELQKGYALGNKVIRHAKVKINKNNGGE